MINLDFAQDIRGQEDLLTWCIETTQIFPVIHECCDASVLVEKLVSNGPYSPLSGVCHIYFVCAFELRGSFLYSFSTHLC